MAARPAWARLAPAHADVIGLVELQREDRACAALTGLASAALFATTLTGHPGLGDAPETVAGISSLGILHAPGYPSYVLAAKAFTLLVPVGSEAFRINLFSLVCASLSVAAVQLLARRCGAPRWSGALGALCLAASAAYWFYSGFAKHDMFSGLLFVIGLHLALAWQARPTTVRLVWLAVAVGVGLGSSWPLEVLLLPTVGWVLVSSRRRLAFRALAISILAGLAVIAALCGFVMIRAAQNPPVDWGGASTPGRLLELVVRADFSQGGDGAIAGVHAPATVAVPREHTHTGSGAAVVLPAGALANRLRLYAGVFGRELGILALVLAGWGLLATLMWRRTVACWPLLVTFAVNLLGVAIAVAAGSSGYTLDLIEEGFVLGSFFVLAVWIAIGAADLVDRAARPRVLRAAASAALAAGLLVPALIRGWPIAHRDAQPLADRYAATMFGELPAHAMLFVWGAELTQPLIERQVVDHQRRDVTVIAADGLSYAWYRQQVSRSLHRALPPSTGDSVIDAARAVESLLGTGRVYLDPQATAVLAGRVAARPDGLVSQALPGTTTPPLRSPAALEAADLAAEHAAGMPTANWSVWPSAYLDAATYATTALVVAREYAGHHDLAGTIRALRNVLAIDPGNSLALDELQATGAAG